MRGNTYIMSSHKDKIVTLRSKGNNQKKKDISQEPEMIELKRMVRDGEISRKRTSEHIKEGRNQA